MNPITPDRNLHKAMKITLTRAANGWIAYDDNYPSSAGSHMFAFESTQSLQKNLVKLLGHSGWTAEREMPSRDGKGHFKPKPTPESE